MKIDDSLSEVFDTPLIVKKEAEVIDASTGEIVLNNEEKIEDDYDHARTNLRQLLLDGQKALSTALSVAQSSEHPRAIEVVGNLMKQLADINQQLLDLHQQKQKLDGPKDAPSKSVTNNSIFVGSTNDLAKMIQNMKKGE
jgi:hypothetical protein